MLLSKPAFARMGVNAPVFTAKTALVNVPDEIAAIMVQFAAAKGENALAAVMARSPIPQTLKDEVASAAGVPFADCEEGFVLRVTGREAEVFADTAAGVTAGCMTLLQCLEDDRSLPAELLWDYPVSKVRGVKLYMPGRGGIDFFKGFVDQMVFFRQNTLMLEIGGAMEYKRHPGINEKWDEYCAFMSEYPGKANEIQGLTGKWYKNSIHFENGEGSWLTQDEVRDLAAYCAARGVEIIPEVPCTSHCDYMLNYRPELAERPDDPYPDTFCPSKPESYELLWDILDEVIEVFQPKIINIGHDEYYSIGVCEVCKARDAAELLTEDITKIYEYLKGKGVRTMFWADKILNMTDNCGFGGAEIKMHKNWNLEKEFWGIIPATWQAVTKLPKDIVCLNWSWGYRGTDEVYRDNGYQVIFGNFSGTEMLRYRERCAGNVRGGIQSNWSVSSDTYLQRNGIYFELAYDNFLFWDKGTSWTSPTSPSHRSTGIKTAPRPAPRRVPSSKSRTRPTAS
jgi:hexosaminidase